LLFLLQKRHENLKSLDADKFFIIVNVKNRIEKHPLDPFLPKNAKLLMLGSFPPPQKRWCMQFYYPNFNNDMWRILGLVFFKDKNYFVRVSDKIFDKEKIVRFLNEAGIAIYDTVREVRRLKDNASDAFLEVVTPTDVPKMLKGLYTCSAVVTTGTLATETLCAVLGAEPPKVGGHSPFLLGNRKMLLYRMPSSSRAYPLALVAKAKTYLSMFKDLEMV